ncbi:MAG TPA: hypothetical protein VKQ11_00490 [Candidatus Sulfotelmatobacter sp.]|nr:hypothetical protein [Candidatus Sulfotelmatobacter sp.]
MPDILSVSGPGSRDKSEDNRLSGPPPLPPDATRPAHKHMKALMDRSDRDQNDPGMGRDSANPFVRKMMSMKNIEMGIRDAVAADPNLSAPMAQILQAAQAAILGSLQSGPGLAPTSAILPPPGMPSPAGAAPGGPSPMPGPAVLPMPPPGQ